jgi:hypothetical protein
MARKARQQFSYNYRPGSVEVSGYFTTVAGTPVTISVTDCPGVTSVTRTDTGNFTINLDTKALDVIWKGGTHQPASGAMCFLLPATLSASTRKTEAKAGTFKIDLRAEAGTETDPTATDLLWVNFVIVTSAAGQR